MFLRFTFLLFLVGSTLAAYPIIANDQDCIADKKFISKAGQPWIKLCKQQTIMGHVIKQSQVVACLGYDGITEVPIGQTYNNYNNEANTTGFRIACKKTAARVSFEVDACLFNQKVVDFGGKGIIGQSICTCEAKYKISCEKIDLFKEQN